MLANRRWTLEPARQDRRVALQNVFLRCAQQGRIAERNAMIDRNHDLALATQARLPGIARLGV